MAEFLRFRRRSDGEFILLNMDHVISIEAGSQQEDEGGWARLTHISEDGVTTLDVLTSLDELSSMLAGVWEKGAD
jgi:hypothetical protein